MKNTSSIAWLIIFLCAIILGLYSLWGYSWHLRKTEDLRGQIDSLKGKIEQLEKEQKSTKEIFPLASPLSTPSASISPSPKPLISPLPEFKKESTNSGRK